MVNKISISIISSVISLFLLFTVLFILFGEFAASHLTLLALFGFIVFLLLDLQTLKKINIVFKSIIAIVINMIVRLIDLNNNMQESKSFSFEYNGSIVEHVPKETNFRFLEFYDSFLILVVTLSVLAAYFITKYFLLLAINKLNQKK